MKINRKSIKIIKIILLVIFVIGAIAMVMIPKVTIVDFIALLSGCGVVICITIEEDNENNKSFNK